MTQIAIWIPRRVSLSFGELDTSPEPMVTRSSVITLLGDYNEAGKRKEKPQLFLFNGLKSKIGYRAEIPSIVELRTGRGTMYYFPRWYSLGFELIYPTSSAELANLPGIIDINSLEIHIVRNPYKLNRDGLVEISDSHRVLVTLDSALDTSRGIDVSLLKDRPFAGVVRVDPKNEEALQGIIGRGNYKVEGEFDLRPKMVVYTEDADVYVVSRMFAILVPRTGDIPIPKGSKNEEELLKELDLVGVIIKNVMGKKILGYRELSENDYIPIYIRDWFKEWKIAPNELIGVVAYDPGSGRYLLHSVGHRYTGKERKSRRKKRMNPQRIYLYPHYLDGVLGPDGKINRDALTDAVDLRNLGGFLNNLSYTNLILAAVGQILNEESTTERLQEVMESRTITNSYTGAVSVLGRIPSPLDRKGLSPIVIVEGDSEIVRLIHESEHMRDLEIPAVKIWIERVPEWLGILQDNPFGVYIPSIQNATYILPNVYILVNRVEKLQDSLKRIVQYLNEKYRRLHNNQLNMLKNYGRITTSDMVRMLRVAILSGDHHETEGEDIHDVGEFDGSDSDADGGGGE